MGNKKFKLRGRMTNFEGKVLDSASIRVLDNKFESLYETYTNDDGEYELEVERGTYYAFIAVKDYKINNLEYWEWNVPVFNDMEINPRIDKLEVYAINAFQLQGAYPAVNIYFRPMSLSKALAAMESGEIETAEIVDICPKLNKESIEVNINGDRVNIFELNKILEYCGGNQHMYSYLIQVALPKDFNKDIYNKIRITLTDYEIGEKGEGSCYWKMETTK